jgi:curved DNA-binding protein CbpA
MQSAATMHVDLYKVLNVKADCTVDEIEASYNELVLQYHPDKIRQRHTMLVSRLASGRKLTDEQRLQLDEDLCNKLAGATTTYNMINTAYQTLSTNRAAYDSEHRQYIANVQDDFSSMRSGAKAFMDAQGSIATDRDHASFRAHWQELNRRHNYSDEQAAALTEKDTNERLKQLRQIREQQDVDTRPAQLFDPKRPMDMARFNAAFERQHTAQNSAGTEIQPFDGTEVTGWGGDGGFADLAADNLYTDAPGGSFASIAQTGNGATNLTPADVASIDVSQSSYKSHNSTSQNDRDEMQRRMAEYRSYGDSLNQRTLTDFKTDVQYGGVVANLESAQPQHRERLEFAATTEQSAQYRKLMESHQRRSERMRSAVQPTRGAGAGTHQQPPNQEQIFMPDFLPSRRAAPHEVHMGAVPASAQVSRSAQSMQIMQQPPQQSLSQIMDLGIPPPGISVRPENARR